MQPSGNTLVLFEEIGGNPAQISFATRQIGSLCSHVSETHPSPIDTWDADSGSGSKLGSLLSLECPFPGQVISSIKFASFGTPHGTCGSFSHGQCSSHRALAIVQKVCIIAHFFIEFHETILFSSTLITLNLYWFILTSLNFYRLVLDQRVVELEHQLIHLATHVKE